MVVIILSYICFQCLGLTLAFANVAPRTAPELLATTPLALRVASMFGLVALLTNLGATVPSFFPLGGPGPAGADIVLVGS